MSQSKKKKTDKRAVEVCARKLMADTRAGYAIKCVENFYSNYGKRAQQARDNMGIDWKALSHAFRAIYQLKDLYTNGDITFPLKEREFILKIKQGELHYLNDGVGTKLDELSLEVKELAEKGHKILVSMRLHGRENIFIDRAIQVIRKFSELVRMDLAEEPKKIGNQIRVNLIKKKEIGAENAENQNSQGEHKEV